MNIYQPYTYLIGWSKQDRWYYGVRYAKHCHPSDLWVTYFTSSKYVTEFRNKYGEPDIIEIRKTFNNSESAIIWEEKVLSKLNVLHNDKWLNQNVAGAFLPNKPAGHQKGSKNSVYGRKRPDIVLYNQTRIHPLLNVRRPNHSKFMSGTNNPMAELGKGLLFWNNGSKTIRSKGQPGPEWVRGRCK